MMHELLGGTRKTIMAAIRSLMRRGIVSAVSWTDQCTPETVTWVDAIQLTWEHGHDAHRAYLRHLQDHLEGVVYEPPVPYTWEAKREFEAFLDEHEDLIDERRTLYMQIRRANPRLKLPYTGYISPSIEARHDR